MNDDYFGYESEDRRDGGDGSANELARNAVERFLESETSDYIAGFDSKHRERPERAERERRIPRDTTVDATGAWPLAAAPIYEEDDEFMTQLASIRRDRPRRDKEPTPSPKPAVRVSEEHRRSMPTDWQETDTDWETTTNPTVSDDDSFQFRYKAGEQNMAPKEARMKDPRPRGSVPMHRRDQASSDGQGGASPLRYLLAFMFVGVLFLMAVLAFNNRNLRQDLYTYQAQVARIEDNSSDLERAQLELTTYQELVAEYRTLLNQMDFTPELPYDAQGLDADIYYPGDEYYTASSHSPPTDETPTYVPSPPPPPEPEVTIYVVQPGDMLGRIANRFYGSSAQVYVNKIMAANNITDASRIQPGDELIIPPRE